MRVCVTIQVKPGSWDFPVAVGGDASSAGTAARRAVSLGAVGTAAESTSHNPEWMGNQMENNPAVSTRHGEGTGAMFSPSKITNCLSSRQVSCCSQMFASCFLWKIALAGFGCVWRAEDLLFSAGAPGSEGDSRAGWCREGNEQLGSRTQTLPA